MADLVFEQNADWWGGGAWVSDTHHMMVLLSSYTPDITDTFVSDLVASEMTSAGYARFTCTGEARTVNGGTNKTEYSTDQPSFGTPITGENVQYLVTYKFVTNDADSLVMALWDFGVVDSLVLNPALGAGNIIATLYGV